MKILSIETSCDETAISIIDAEGGFEKPVFKIRGNQILTQAQMHAEYGGVFPNLAKREHSKNILPLLVIALTEAKMFKKNKKKIELSEKETAFIRETLEREPALLEPFLEFIVTVQRPDIDALAVTAGPGLAPALWVGVNFAKALSIMWDIPLLPMNHMEGHIIASLLQSDKTGKKITLPAVSFPALALLISGGHTELVVMKDWMKYKKIGATKDDAVGEAFDKVARMMKLPYPGGPHISRIAETVPDHSSRFKLPRPMISTNDYDFSFSGLKTAVLYTIQKIDLLTPKMKAEIANEFENAVTEVLLAKTLRAAKEYKVKTVLIGGGVSANTRIRNTFAKKVPEKLENVKLYVPQQVLSTDNALMISTAAYFRLVAKKKFSKTFRADGNLSL